MIKFFSQVVSWRMQLMRGAVMHLRGCTRTPSLMGVIVNKSEPRRS